jgi:hypothetical protein
LEGLPLNFTARRQLLYGIEKSDESESVYMGSVHLRPPKREIEKRNRNVLLSGHAATTKAALPLMTRLGDNPPESEEAIYSHMVSRHLNINPNATRICNVTKEECAAY